MSTTATKETSGAGAPVQTPLVALHGVTKRFGPVQALTSVDLEIPSGQVTALVGDNGAGKSVLGYNRMLWTALKREAAYLPG